MIAKRVPRDKATSDFARLGRYVVDAIGGIDPASWTRTADYILDTAHDGAKVGGVRITNCNADGPAEATMEILATQAMNTRSKSDKSYHLVISFPAGETPPLDTLHAIEDQLCAAIGLADHQRISAVHTDTDHLHIHVAINKVHPQTLRNVEPYYDMPRLMKACDEIEVTYGLQRTNHGLQVIQPPSQEQDHDRNRPNPIVLDADPAEHARRNAGVRERYRADLAGDGESRNLDAMPVLSGGGLDTFAAIPQLLLQDDARPDVEQSEPGQDQLVRRVRGGDGRVSAQGRLDDSSTMPGRAGDMEAHAGRESLTRWIKREAAPALLQADSWEAVHTSAAQLGLTVQLHGAGLVIGTPDGAANVKASDVARALSLPSLTRRLGPFVPAAAATARIPAQKQYTAAPRQPHASSAALFTQFQRERAEAQRAKLDATTKLRTAHTAYSAQLAQYHRRRRAVIQASRLTPGARKTAYQALAAERTRDWKTRQALEAAQRAELAKNHAQPVWQDWLAKRASAGDAVALEVLRSKARKQERFMADWLRAPDLTAAKHVILKHLSPKADKTGALNYSMPDGGTVKDTTAGIRVVQSTDAAALLALTLAAEKYAGQTLIIAGSDAFRQQVARLAGEHGVNVEFADASLEQTRTFAIRPTATAPAATPAPEKPPAVKPQEKPPTAIESFLLERNSQRKFSSTIVYHRAWTAQDAGAASYQGRRRLSDGSEIVLLQKGDTMLALPVTGAQAAKAAQWRVGTEIATDARGRFVSQQQRPSTPTKGKTR